MSDYVDFRSDWPYDTNLCETIDFCRRELSRYVVARHDDPLYEYTMYVDREPPA